MKNLEVTKVGSEWRLQYQGVTFWAAKEFRYGKWTRRYRLQEFSQWRTVAVYKTLKELKAAFVEGVNDKTLN